MFYPEDNNITDVQSPARQEQELREVQVGTAIHPAPDPRRSALGMETARVRWQQVGREGVLPAGH